jgi:hypothetical protein
MRAGHPFSKVVQEAKDMGNEWPPLIHGFFQGSIDRFLEIEAGYEEIIKRSRWI